MAIWPAGILLHFFLLKYIYMGGVLVIAMLMVEVMVMKNIFKFNFGIFRDFSALVWADSMKKKENMTKSLTPSRALVSLPVFWLAVTTPQSPKDRKTKSALE